MKQSEILTNQKAQELLSLKKIFKENPGRPLRLNINECSATGKEVILLQSEDGLENFSLSIIRSRKRIAKVTFNHVEKSYNYCLFRLDINGAPHTNPKNGNEFVPDEFLRYAGIKLSGSHVHYYIEGYGPELGWALPLSETEFSDFEKNKDIESTLQFIIDKVRAVINLSDQIIYDKLIDYGQQEMD